MPATNTNLEHELQRTAESMENLALSAIKAYRSLIEITELSDQECDALEAEFRKKNILQ